MATDKRLVPNIDNSDPTNYPNARIRDNTGSGNGTPVNRLVYSDLHEMVAKLMRMANIAYNNLPDNEGNGYQLVNALIALAGKNDYIVALNTSGGVLQVNSLTLSILQTNETLLCKAAVDYVAETTIKGSEASIVKPVSVPSAYKAGDYLRLTYNGTTVSLIREANALNLDVLVTALLYLKAATNVQAIAGTATTAAITPANLMAAFVNWVNGADSTDFLASSSQNGLLSAADKTTINTIGATKNIGWFSGVDPGGGTVGQFAPRAGDVVSAQINEVHSIAGPNSDVTYLVTMANAMADTNYVVKTFIESQGTLGFDDDIGGAVFRPVDETTFLWALSDTAASTQNLKIHIEVIQLSA